jgi:hypothetical protein
LRSIAVVHVEVDDRDATDAAHRLHVACCDRNVVHQAKAHRALRRRVVSRRPHEREPTGLGGVDRAAGREEARLPAGL